ncbi:Integration host factor subunit alpha [Buchnera aphidicola (Protaphis terricola)]|uniref:integration host factor subunit alpha n=1 Tax=Buchnera aphidicola TaxID=9 RepID=UPI003463B4E4
MVLTKSKISENLFEKFNLNKRISKAFVYFFFEEIVKSLEKGENVKLSGFGNFKLINKKERPGRNPKTGKKVIISKRRVVVFKAGRKLKNRISNCFIKNKY